jgi:hypothetical protein
MQTRADGLAWTMHTRAEGLPGHATTADSLALTMQTRAKGLAWIMQTRAEGLPGHANYRADGLL